MKDKETEQDTTPETGDKTTADDDTAGPHASIDDPVEPPARYAPKV